MSQRESAQIDIDLGSEVRLQRTLSRVEFEALASPFIERTILACERALLDAGGIAIDRVILVGGSTRIPLVRKRVGEFLGWNHTRRWILIASSRSVLQRRRQFARNSERCLAA